MYVIAQPAGTNSLVLSQDHISFFWLSGTPSYSCVMKCLTFYTSFTQSKFNTVFLKVASAFGVKIAIDVRQHSTPESLNKVKWSWLKNECSLYLLLFLTFCDFIPLWLCFIAAPLFWTIQFRANPTYCLMLLYIQFTSYTELMSCNF